MGSTQSISVSDATAYPVNSYVLVSDGTHTIIGQVTANSGSPITVKTTDIVERGRQFDEYGCGSFVQWPERCDWRGRRNGSYRFRRCHRHGRSYGCDG